MSKEGAGWCAGAQLAPLEVEHIHPKPLSSAALSACSISDPHGL